MLNFLIRYGPGPLRNQSYVSNFCCCCCTSLPLASTRWVGSTIKHFFTHCPHALVPINLYDIKKFEFLWETPRIELGPAGWEAQTLPLCYADPPMCFIFCPGPDVRHRRPDFHRRVPGRLGQALLPQASRRWGIQRDPFLRRQNREGWVIRRGLSRLQ